MAYLKCPHCDCAPRERDFAAHVQACRARMTDSRVQAEQIAQAIAWDEYGNESNGYASWDSNHSCGVLRYGCCGGGHDIDREELARAIASALAAAAPQWQPIETAPKDGSRILVVWGRTVRLVHWHEAEGPRGSRFANWLPDDKGAVLALEKPTHWMPLPSLPPQEETGR